MVIIGVMFGGSSLAAGASFFYLTFGCGFCPPKGVFV